MAPAKKTSASDVASRRNTTSTPARCDLCYGNNGCLKQCCACGVHVHDDCYGLSATQQKDASWKCWACKSVGKEIQGRTLNHHKSKTLVQAERPTECALCSVADGIHAMHALYDDHGSKGKQVILPSNKQLPQRLAWVHSLCAMTVCSHRGTRGSVYGCDVNGDYEGDNPVHHFVMCGLNGNKAEDADWVRMLDQHRRLQCTLCGLRDVTAGRNLRVPLQCCAGDEGEFWKLKSRLRDVGDPCTQAMHVGCAMWGTKTNPPQYRRMFFDPGSIADRDSDEGNEPVTEIYCNLHASKIKVCMLSNKRQATETKAGGTILQYGQDKQSDTSTSPNLPTYSDPSVKRRASSYLCDSGIALGGKRRSSKHQQKGGLVSNQTKTVRRTSSTSIHASTTAIAKVPTPVVPKAKVAHQQQSSSVRSISRKAPANSSGLAGAASTIRGKATTTHPHRENLPSSPSSRVLIPKETRPVPNKGTTSSGDTIGGAIRMPREGTMPHRGKFTSASSSPTAMRSCHLVPVHMHKKRAGYDDHIHNGSKASGQSSPTSFVAPSADKDSSDSVAASAPFESVSIARKTDGHASSAPVREQPSSNMPSRSVAASSSSNDLEVSPSVSVLVPEQENESESEILSIPPLKRRRVRSISEEKDKDDNEEMHMTNLEDSARCVIENNATLNDYGDIWLDDSVQGVAGLDDTEPEVDRVRQGEDPWAYLWEPNAPPFEIELQFCAERRSRIRSPRH